MWRSGSTTSARLKQCCGCARDIREGGSCPCLQRCTSASRDVLQRVGCSSQVSQADAYTSHSNLH